MTLDDWLAFAPQLEAIYQQELGRSAFSDQQAFVNWTYHWREFQHDLDWIRARIQESPEWQQKHASGGSPLPPSSPPPSIPVPAGPPPPSPPSASGGMPTSADDSTIRPRLTTAEIRALLPDRGPFTFPLYGTQGIRLTNASDGEIRSAGYAYYPQVNNHAGRPTLLVFVGHSDGQTRFFQVNKATGGVTPIESVAPINQYRGTAELWYWSASRATTLYLYDGPRLRRVDVVSGQDEVVFDISARFPNCRVWQAHSSQDDQTHCATVQAITSNGPYQDLGCVVGRHGELKFFPAEADYDESAIDPSGRWLVIKETYQRDRPRLDNRVIDLDSGQETRLHDEAGAVGHSDMADHCVIGEDDQHEPCGVVRWDLTQPFTPDRRQVLYYRPDWVGGMGHVSVRGGKILVSNGHPSALPRANELILVSPTGDKRALAVAPNLMILPPGDVPYELQVQANLDPIGEYAMWTANGGGRTDAFLVSVPRV